MPERDPTRINERIRIKEVRLIDEEGEQVGVIATEAALEMARERDLDLVEVAPDARPPVARLLDYSKYKYEQEQKAKAARKHQQQVNVREIKLRPKIADHDYETKKGHVERFLRHKDKVKVTIMFRGREQAHPERGRALLQRLYDDISEIATIEAEPQQEGRNMHMMLAPSKELLAQQQRDEAPSGWRGRGGRRRRGRRRRRARRGRRLGPAPSPWITPRSRSSTSACPEADRDAVAAVLRSGWLSDGPRDGGVRARVRRAPRRPSTSSPSRAAPPRSTSRASPPGSGPGDEVIVPSHDVRRHGERGALLRRDAGLLPTWSATATT